MYNTSWGTILKKETHPDKLEFYTNLRLKEKLVLFELEMSFKPSENTRNPHLKLYNSFGN